MNPPDLLDQFAKMRAAQLQDLMQGACGNSPKPEGEICALVHALRAVADELAAGVAHVEERMFPALRPAEPIDKVSVEQPATELGRALLDIQHKLRQTARTLVSIADRVEL